jgi:hypothetical protein
MMLPDEMRFLGNLGQWQVCVVRESPAHCPAFNQMLLGPLSISTFRGSLWRLLQAGFC